MWPAWCRTQPCSVLTALDRQAFAAALAMCGLAAFGGGRLAHSALRTPEQQLAAFLVFMGLQPLPGQEDVLLCAEAAAASAAAASRAAGGGGGVAGGSGRLPCSDAYIGWWSMVFDPAESRAHDQLSSLHYLPVMLQVSVSAGACCSRRHEFMVCVQVAASTTQRLRPARRTRRVCAPAAGSGCTSARLPSRRAGAADSRARRSAREQHAGRAAAVRAGSAGLASTLRPAGWVRPA
jgi:hypothetical protein